MPADGVGDECRRRLDSAELVGVENLHARHVEDYAKYFSRSRLNLGQASYLDSPSGADVKKSKQAIKHFSCPRNSRLPIKQRVARLGQTCTLDNHAVATDAEAKVVGTLGAASARNARIADPDLLALTYVWKIKPNQTKPNQIKSNHIKANQSKSSQIKSNQTKSRWTGVHCGTRTVLRLQSLSLPTTASSSDLVCFVPFLHRTRKTF